MAGKMKKSVQSGQITVGLADPGMTPLLRAGLGGLAASVRALLIESDPTGNWPRPLELPGGRIMVDSARVQIEWSEGGPAGVLGELFKLSFRIRQPEGLIELPGWWEGRRPELALAMALQNGLKRTFLQHCTTTKKGGKATLRTVTVDEQETSVMTQPYISYAHQGAWKAVVEAINKGGVRLASWAYPGAVQRHIGFRCTTWVFSPGAALAALFGPVGCLSYEVPRSGGCGVLVIPEPTDVVGFAIARPKLTAQRLSDAYVTGPGDAVLAVHLAMSIDTQLRRVRGIGAVHGLSLRAMPWSTQQKTRSAVLTVQPLPERMLDQYHHAQQALPTIIQLSAKDKKQGGGQVETNGFFAATSQLRRFVSENIAAGRAWHTDFAIAKSHEKPTRFLHYYRRDGLGALIADERKGLTAMIPYLEEAEATLVRSVHQALRQRFGAIADETTDLPPATRHKRMSGERERWRLAFVGCKTPEQIRAALANLWSRAGPNAELRVGWESVLPLLRADRWQTARDLALVALASYSGKGADVPTIDDETAANTPANEEKP